MTTPTVPAGSGPFSITVDPSGKFVYVANDLSDNVSQYTIGPDGSLTPMTTPTVPAGSGPFSITVDPSGKFVYVANDLSDNVSQYTIGPDGSLTPMTTPTVPAGSGPFSITVDPSGKYAYVANEVNVANESGDISQYTIGSDGSLTPMTTPTVTAELGARSVTVDPSGKYAYVANDGSTTVSEYTIAPDGSLTPMTTPTVTAGVDPHSVTVDPSGKYAYVANWNSENVSQYTIGPDGSLSPMAAPTVPAGYYSQSIVTVGSYAAAPAATITANPTRVPSGSSATIAWSASNVKQCTVTSSTGAVLADGTANAQDNFLLYSPQSVVITQQTVFTISCTTNGSPVSSQAIVNIPVVSQGF